MQTPKTVFKMAAVRHLELGKFPFLVTWPYRQSANKAPRNSQKRFSIWRPSAILNLKNFDFFVKFAWQEWKFVSVYQIWSKADKSQLRYGDKAIFKMAAVRHLEFAKIAILVKWPISACDSSSPFRNLHKSTNMAPIYSQKRFSVWRLSAILNLKNVDFCQIYMLGIEICICVPNLIEIGRFSAEIWR